MSVDHDTANDNSTSKEAPAPKKAKGPTMKQAPTHSSSDDNKAKVQATKPASETSKEDPKASLTDPSSHPPHTPTTFPPPTTTPPTSPPGGQALGLGTPGGESV